MAEELILVVDDDELVCSQAEMALRKSKYRTMTAFNGHQALAIIRETETPPDLLLSDIRMPDIDGLQLFAAARKIRFDLLGVLMTGYGTIDIAIKALQLGVSGFLQKPFTGVELDHVIEDAFSKNRLMSEAVRLRLLSPLLEARRYLISELNLTNFCQGLVETTAHEAQADYCAVFLPDEKNMLSDRSTLHPEAVFMEATEKARVFSPRTFPAGRMAGRALEVGRTLSLRRSGTDKLNGDTTIPGLVLAVPLVASQRTLGVLLVGRAQVDKAFSTGERELFEVLAGQLASILDNRRLYQTLSAREERLHTSLNRFMEAQESENKQLAAHIQTEFLPLLNSTRQNVQAYLEKARPVAGSEDLLQAEQRLQTATASVRRLLNDLRPASLEDYGLSAALRQYVQDYNHIAENQPKLIFKLEGPEAPRLGGTTETGLFRACTEAITNAVQHAPGSPIEVLIWVTGQRNQPIHLQIQIIADGPDFEAGSLEEGDPSQQLGLLTMQERVAMVGGVCHIESKPGGGTKVTIDYATAD